MENANFTTRYNIMDIKTIQSFVGITGGFNHECKDVYFIRYVGYNQSYLDDIEKMDRLLAMNEIKGIGKYLRICELPKLIETKDIEMYSEKYKNWIDSNRKKISFKIIQNNVQVKAVINNALQYIFNIFNEHSQNISDSIQKNFMIKIMYWMESTCGKLLNEWNGRSTNKIVYYGKIKKQEYLFFYFLTCMGFDVLLLVPNGKIEVDSELLELSECITLGQMGEIKIPKYDATKYKRISEMDSNRTVISAKTGDVANRVINALTTQSRTELKFEELALLASSVVMIGVHNREGKVFSTGSGIMISKEGYILTNNHVVSGGMFYSVRIEDNEEIYQTDELIKYNPVFDLALIRIHKNCNPIPVYKGIKPLVRGQKVVAIGSPLGLFNSVSDGIISGFRNIDDVNMIQFTAPISHGSSGGAVLNMCGEIIGISTAGIDKGQNINLAIDYTDITEFIRGFVMN